MLSKFKHLPFELPGSEMKLVVDIVIAHSQFQLIKQPYVQAHVSGENRFEFTSKIQGFALLPLELNEILHGIQFEVYMEDVGIEDWLPTLHSQVLNICNQVNITTAACTRLNNEAITIQDWIHSDRIQSESCEELSFTRLRANGINVCLNLTDLVTNNTLHHCKHINSLVQEFVVDQVRQGRTYIAQTYIETRSHLRGVQVSDIATISFIREPLQILSPKHGANILSSGFDIEWSASESSTSQFLEVCVYLNGTKWSCNPHNTSSFIQAVPSGVTEIFVQVDSNNSLVRSTKIKAHVMDVNTTLQLLFVTACDEGYVQNGRLANLVGSIHFWEPSSKLEIYDLGLSAASRAEISTWRHVTLHQLPFDDLPDHFRDLRRTYSFKPWGLYQALQRSRHVLWIDSNMELRQPVDSIRDILLHHGVFYTIQRQRFPNTRFHSLVTIKRFNCTSPLYSRHQVPAGLQGYTRGSWAYEHVLKPLVECAMEEECIAPLGTNRSNHRQDQTVLNSLLCSLGVNESLIHDDLRFWISSHIDDLAEVLQPTGDPTTKNEVVIYTRREHPWKPYTEYIRRHTKE